MSFFNELFFISIIVCKFNLHTYCLFVGTHMNTNALVTKVFQYLND